MVKRYRTYQLWEKQSNGAHVTNLTEAAEVVAAADYDLLEAENAKMRAGYPYLAECLRL